MRIEVINKMRERYPVATLCRLLQVQRSVYYWYGRRSVDDQAALRASIRRLYEQHRGRYGSPRITHALRAEGWVVNHKRVERLMRLEGLRARMHRRRSVRTTDSRHSLPIAPNRLEQRFTVDSIDKVWLTDTTYVPTREGWLYVTTVLDLCSKRIVGWSMSHRNDRHMVCDALTMALELRRPGKDLILHSDRGSTFASHDVRTLLAAHGVKQSMSRKGNCYDNAPAESWFATFKRESDAGDIYPTRSIARADIFEYIELYYNNYRLHSALNFYSPIQYERLHARLT